MKRHFVSYPKSGRTWVRYVLSQLGLDGLIHFHHDGFEFNDGGRPSHDFDIDSRRLRYAKIDKVVYLERDPRDVMVSLYFQITGRFKDFFNYEGTLSDFIHDDYFGASNLHRFRLIWKELVQERSFHVIRYEQCHMDMLEVMRRLLDYYEFTVEPAQIEAAVAAASFDRMKAVEQSGTFAQPWLRPRQGAPKVRSGRVGGHRSALSDADITYLNEVFGSMDDRPHNTSGA